MARPRSQTRRTTKKKSAAKGPAIPRRIFANASPKSLGGVSMFDAGDQINAETVANFFSEMDLLQRAALRLQDAGFDVLQVTNATINISGTQKMFENAFNTKIVADERPVIKEAAEETTATFLECPDTDMPGLISPSGSPFEDIIEGIAIEEPRYYMAPSMFPPHKAYWHLDVPAGVSLGCNADRAHRGAITGRGVKVAMVDSGHFKHPFFTARGYRVAPVVLGPAAASALKDESGHGTGESANIFALAPDTELLPVKMSFVNSKGAFDAAVGLGPDIITCSWGSSKRFGPLSAADQALATSIATAVASGIIVIFSAGNGHWGFPGQHPDVMSAGGVFMDEDESLNASDYSSGFTSNIYSNRRVPDLSGLVGMRPTAMYIMLPLEPGDSIDTGNAGGNHPGGDETATNDGWAAFSGTSAAAPQLAGASALIKQACPALTPAAVRDVLMKSARDVTKGKCHPNTGANSATTGPDTATGNGLVDAHKAVLVAKIRCRGIAVGPPTPIGPAPPAPPIIPAPRISPVPPPPQPIRPIVPIRPIGPIRPIMPIRPVGPIRPIRPITGPLSGEAPGGMAHPAQQAISAGQLSAEDVEALEQMALDSELDASELD